MDKINLRFIVGAAFLLSLAVLPLLATAAGDSFYITLFSRIMIYGLATLGLNLILGYGGLVSLGHALYIGIGAYAVGILSAHGITSGWLQLLAAFMVGTVVAMLVGVVCLRTRGMAFIMITLAFAQMAYYIAIGLRNYGGEDGMAVPMRSDFGLFSLSNSVVLYYAIFTVLLLVLYLSWRMMQSRFGFVLRASRSNLTRMSALGFPMLRYRLTAYVLSALVCVVAGFFLANVARYIAPSYMAWHVSAELIVMAVLGGMGSLLGPVIGATALLTLEEFLGSMALGLPWGLDSFINTHFMIIIGVVVVLIALSLQQGLYGYLTAREQRLGHVKS
ncbi:branched-chain amino acid ABC transporter permease [Eoetvoesiella caeni]|uniref:Branched-chain amino acid transport system permease protein n=1 Tax=Eoetvoesiella caeni TaxID=645616 RepID=A0A366H0H5_9BURK|nr:branched-chain amino acid ABC transporter permease [Eoetvoesiella caeni]MCI2811245.1 branched-chain amino acid ABC transporter permease [Eoetvoesiella caeni]NYT57146.1 branched-chain amino acid ABC transporter permease [Eoetvoesiella caeni]RBP33658.1 branched-chain amino acid transport system permease protein [Eoetvoesiella caeni]